MVTVGTKPCRPRIRWLGPMPRPGEFSGSTRTSWNLTQRTSSSSPANPQPASPETEGCSSRFSEIWQSRHTLPMVRANKMQSNLCGNWRRAPCPTSKHAAKWARPKKSPTGFAAGAFWHGCRPAHGRTSYRHRLATQLQRTGKRPCGDNATGRAEAKTSGEGAQEWLLHPHLAYEKHPIQDVIRSHEPD